MKVDLFLRDLALTEIVNDILKSISVISKLQKSSNYMGKPFVLLKTMIVYKAMLNF